MINSFSVLFYKMPLTGSSHTGIAPQHSVQAQLKATRCHEALPCVCAFGGLAGRWAHAALVGGRRNSELLPPEGSLQRGADGNCARA